MKCLACDHENPDHARFCLECGAAFAMHCCGCKAELPPRAKFCLECGAAQVQQGSVIKAAPDPDPEPPPRRVADYTPKHLAEKILQSKSALEGERKQVTVLFADVKGSMELAEQLDPEEWHRILERFFEILSDGVHHFEGTVNQYTGDGIMALFGAPIAHEDHAQRACLAALYLRDALRTYADSLRRTHGLSFATRMGLNSGEVVVGSIGDDLRMDYTAQGHTVGLAQRMEQLAEPGTAYLTEDTARLVEGFFALRALGAFELKGATAPLGVFVLEGLGSLHTRLDLSQSRGFSKFVGRADEVATLEAAFEQSLQAQGRTVGVVAEAGTGKSRLCFEFLEHCRARGYPVIEARAVAHGRHVPLLPMLELFRAYFGVQREDNERTVREKIAGRLLLLDASLREDLPLFFNLLGVPDPERPLPPIDPDLMQRRVFAALRAIVRADGQRDKPAIVYFEDLHWLDPASDGYLAQIIEAIATSRGLVLVNFRPEYRAPWMQMPYYQQLPLVPLGPEAVSELMEDLLGRDESIVGLADFIYQRAGGNPFFVEEVVQTLIETGVLEGSRGHYRLLGSVEVLVLPATVQAVLTARIDRLSEHEKRVLQQASVIGKTFQARVLARITDVPGAEFEAALRALCTAEFLHEAALYPHVEYTFKHPLTQEVAERSQMNDHRAETHGAVARIIEELSAERLDEEAALLAHHWAAAGEHRIAAEWHARAARWIGISNFAEASAHWRQVVNLIADTDDAHGALTLRVEALRNLLMLAFRVETSEQEVTALFNAGCRALERLGDDVGRAAMLLVYGINRQNAGDTDEYVAVVAEGYEIARRSGDREAIAAADVEYEYALAHKGRLAESVAVAEGLRVHCAGDVQLGIALSGYSAYIGSYMFAVLPLARLGRIDEAENAARRGVELTQQHGPDETRCWASMFFTFVGDARGAQAPDALQLARLAVEAAERAGSDSTRLTANVALAVAYLGGEQWESTIEAAAVAFQIWRNRHFFGDLAPLLLTIQARALLGAGELENALAACAEALDIARRENQPLDVCNAVIVQARCLRQLQGEPARAEIETLLAEVVQIIDQTGAELWRPHVHAERAELCRFQGDSQGAEREFNSAHRMFNAMGASGHAARIARELGVASTAP